MLFRIRNDAGFSLVETMVATFIFALVSAAGVALLTSYQSGREMLQAADGRVSEITLAREVIKADLLAALDRPARMEMGEVRGFTGSAYLPDGLKLSLVRGGGMRAVLDTGESALERVDYVLEGDKLVRRTFKRTDITTANKPRDRVMLEGVKAMALRFESEGQWIEEWRPEVALKPLPNLAELSFQMANGRSLRFVLLVGGQA
ncbi:type II secretion system minor pseudopilin GspJ [Kordiimonas lipolytica]|uniref:Type II secretion system protein J n=1 Tax=Kordiimonas lipolytica TaxID=1662421 RepID=A0ABV8UAX3_9PROT|nr:type II secretion system minor pseudopilin GspJ [Kordiimonas lipolytica]